MTEADLKITLRFKRLYIPPTCIAIFLVLDIENAVVTDVAVLTLLYPPVYFDIINIFP